MYDNQGDTGDVVEVARNSNLKTIIALHEQIVAAVVAAEEEQYTERFLLEIVDMSVEPRRYAKVVHVTEGTCEWEVRS